MIPIHCLGDSITQAGGLPECGRWTVVLQMRLEAWRPGAYAVYTNGVGGDTTAMGLERMGVAERDGGVTLIEFGFNDAACRPFGLRPRVGPEEYRANLHAMGEIVRNRGGEPLFVVNHRINFTETEPQSDGEYYGEKMERYNRICREVAESLDAATVDLSKLMAERKVDPAEFFADGVHLSASGNRTYADLVFGVLRPILEGRAP